MDICSGKIGDFGLRGCCWREKKRTFSENLNNAQKICTDLLEIVPYCDVRVN